MKQQQSFYNKLWREWDKEYENPDIGWVYEKRRIDNKLINLIRDKLEKSKEIKVLEIGIGKGDLANKLFYEYPNIDYVGVDISEEGIKIAKNKINSDFEFCVASGTSLPLKNYQFDIVICSEVIEHIIAKNQLISEQKRVLKADGILLITTPNPKSITYWIPRLLNKMHKIRYGSNQPINELIGREILEQMLRNNGFESIQCFGLVYKPYTINLLESIFKRPLILARMFSEYLERKNIFVNIALYQVFFLKKWEKHE